MKSTSNQPRLLAACHAPKAAHKEFQNIHCPVRCFISRELDTEYFTTSTMLQNILPVLLWRECRKTVLPSIGIIHSESIAIPPYQSRHRGLASNYSFGPLAMMAYGMPLKSDRSTSQRSTGHQAVSKDTSFCLTGSQYIWTHEYGEGKVSTWKIPWL